MKFEFKNGDVFYLDNDFIIKEMAEYYSKVDGTTIEEALNEVSQLDHYDLEDWLLNNYNWSDIADECEQVERGVFLHNDHWPDVDVISYE